MRHRILFVIVSGFFVTMNVLLWRAEFGAQSSGGTIVPPEIVWSKVLTSPDDSFLQIRHHGAAVGHARWVASVKEDPMPETGGEEEASPEGMVRQVTGYSLDFDGNVTLDGATRLRFNFIVKLDSAQAWQELSMRMAVKPYSWKIHAAAQAQTATFLAEDDEERKERTYTFAELRSPEKILHDLGGPTFAASLAALRLSLPRGGTGAVNAAAPALLWEARHDRLKVGSNFIRVYRLEARLLQSLRAVVFVSPVGEILRLELPDEIVLTNDALTTL